MPDTLLFEDSRLPKWTPASSPTAPRVAGAQPVSVEWALSHWSAAAHAHHPRPDLSLPSPPPVHDCNRLINAAVHDMRNSLSAIRLGMELLARRGDPQQPDAVLEHVDHAANRAIERSEELADVCRLATGKNLDIATKPFSLHAVIRQAIDALAASASSATQTVFEHDRLGDGDCCGDAARIAQFLTLALEELASSGWPSRVIVVSEVAGDRFRIALCEGAATVERQSGDRPDALLARTRRHVLLHGIAGAHRGRVAFGDARGGRPSIEGSFRSVRRGPPAGD
ncbi:HAMP domain-containing histidine kinase [Variovorax sp. IB41]|uniref:HAMP domain-containing histidine kinase n=1 Tax=Variovorax sp. IB41 TaxID=2779370 RepID=UPI0018E8644A|nr:HAMP domain-containing histidine kinase [Variovorax sp. IB41]MBJ2154684.1 HAMP domain-containing histidine kinase [Variovorax sp. IB41]